MKTYLIINPFNDSASHGIHNYIINLIDELKALNITYDYIYNHDLSLHEYREYVYNYIHKNYGYEEVIIEAPETKAATLYLEDTYLVHIRLHTPGAIAQKYDSKPVDQSAYSNELRVINKAHVVSSPSYGLLKELKSELNINNIFVYKNPYNKNIKYTLEKTYDLIFLGRFQILKGIEYINPILEKLPKHFKVLLVGNNSHALKITKNVSCDVTVYDHISDTRRFELIAKSKSIMLLSKFENCSMIILEALACNTIINAWDVGGNSEISDNSVLKIIPFENIISMTNQIIDNAEQDYPVKKLFSNALQEVSTDFNTGLKNLISYIEKDTNKIYKGIDFSNLHSKSLDTTINSDNSKYHIQYSKKNFGDRIFGFSISNEHIEEMWMPIINKFSAEYLFVSKRELGSHTCFDYSYPVDENRYMVYDWIKYPEKLLADIKKFKPNKIFFHNGSHPSYQKALKFIKENIDIPIIYSELGWFPQRNHIYFDTEGTNGKSKISLLDFESFTGHTMPNTKKYEIETSKPILIVTQTENDTNLIVNSKRFKKNITFIEYILEELSLINSKYKIVIKTHPLDKNKLNMEKFNSENITVVHEHSIQELLSSCQAIIGINSTVLLEALKYDCNIYFFGESLLANKNIAIDCRSSELSKVWKTHTFTSKASKNLIVQEFTDRQINLNNLNVLDVNRCLNSKAFEPLLVSSKYYDTKKVLRSSLPKRKHSHTKAYINKYEKTPFERKICKLLFHTESYFRDSNNKKIKFMWKYYCKIFT